MLLPLSILIILYRPHKICSIIPFSPNTFLNYDTLSSFPNHSIQFSIFQLYLSYISLNNLSLIINSLLFFSIIYLTDPLL